MTWSLAFSMVAHGPAQHLQILHCFPSKIEGVIPQLSHLGDSATLAIIGVFSHTFLYCHLLVCLDDDLLHLLEAACCFLLDDFTSKVCTKKLLHFPALSHQTD